MRAVRRRTAVGGLVLMAALGAWAPMASASPAWLAPVDLSAPRASGFEPDVAMNAAGDAAVVWQRAGIVQAVVRPAGGPFAQRVDLTVAGGSAGGAQGAIDGAGSSIVVWRESDAIRAAVRPAGGAFSAPVELAASGYQPRVAMNEAGDGVVAWQHYDGTNQAVQAAVRPAGGSFSAPVQLSATGEDDYRPDVAIDGAGNAVVAWEHYNGTHQVVRAAVRPAGTSFSAPVQLSAAGEYASGPQVAMGQSGDAVVVWERTDGPSRVVRAAARPAGGAFSPPVDVAAADGYPDPRVAMDRAGDAVAVWEDYDGTIGTVYAAVRPAGGSFSTPVQLSVPGEYASRPQVAMGQSGDAVATWEGSTAANSTVRAAVRPAGTSFSAPVQLSVTDPGGGPQVAGAMDQAGNGIAVWRGSNGTDSIVQAAGYDGAAPQLRGLAVPATGVAGRPVSFSASPFDVWSPIDTSWTFGDGSSATGTSPTHTYATPGTFTVGITASDALATSASASRAITIAPAPPPPRLTGSSAPAPRAPVVSGLRLRPSAFRAATSGSSVRAAATRGGTRVSYALDAAARVRFTVQRATRGRRVGRRCVKRSRANRARRPCTRFVPVPGSFTRVREAGQDRFTFTGRLAGRALRPGRHRLLVTPVGSGRTGTMRRASFRIAS